MKSTAPERRISKATDHIEDRSKEELLYSYSTKEGTVKSPSKIPRTSSGDEESPRVVTAISGTNF